MNKKNREKRKQNKWRNYGDGYINSLEIFKLYLTDEVDKSKILTATEINNAVRRTQEMLAMELKEKIELELNFIRG